MGRCKVHRLGTNDLDRSVDDPALALLLSSGWSVVAPIAIEEKGEVYIALILAPPMPYYKNWKSISVAVIIGLLAGLVTFLVAGVA